VTRFYSLSRLAAFAICLGASAQAAEHLEIGWQPIQIVTIDLDDFEGSRLVLAATLKDFSVSESEFAATLDDFLALVAQFGSVREHEKPTADQARRIALANKRLGLGRDPIANEARLSDIFLKYHKDSAEEGGSLLLDVLENDIIRKICSLVELASFENAGFAPTNRFAAAEFIDAAKSSIFLQPEQIELDRSLFAGDEWWDPYNLWYGELKDEPVSRFGREQGAVPIGSVRLSFIPIEIRGLSPTILSGIAFSSIGAEEIQGLPRRVRIPTALVVGSPHGLPRSDVPAEKNLTLPVSEWAKVLWDKLMGGEKTYFVFGIFYQYVDLRTPG
jgi:hypothetical protein